MPMIQYRRFKPSISSPHSGQTSSSGLQRLFRPNLNGRTPLHSAATDHRDDVLDGLLVAKLSPNLTDQHGQTPLHLAAAAGKIDAVDSLVLYMAPLDSPEHLAQVQYRARHLEALGTYSGGNLKTLDKLRPDPEALNKRDNNEQTALHLAAENGHVEVVEQLLCYVGAEVNATDIKGQTPLHLAAKKGLSGVAEVLLRCSTYARAEDTEHEEARAEDREHEEASRVKRTTSERPKKSPSIDMADENGQTALHLAAGSGLNRLIDVLLGKGADANIKDREGQTALFLAVRNQPYSNVANLLSRDGTKLDEQDGKDRTALHWAAELGFDGHVQQLLEKGAKTDVRDKEGRTALHLAAGSGHDRAVKRLLENGAQTGARDRKDQTAFHLAAEYGHEGVIQLLLEHAVETDAEDGEGRTALHLATANGRGRVIRRLLENGVRPSTLVGQEVLQLISRKLKVSKVAEEEEAEQTLRLLLKKDTGRGLDVNTAVGLDILGWTTRRWSSGDPSSSRDITKTAIMVAKLLIDHGAEVNRTIPSLPPRTPTALLSAASSAHKKVLAELLKAGDLGVSGGYEVLEQLINESEENDGRQEILPLLKQALDRHHP